MSAAAHSSEWQDSAERRSLLLTSQRVDSWESLRGSAANTQAAPPPFRRGRHYDGEADLGHLDF